MTAPRRTALNIVIVTCASVLQIVLQFLFSRTIAGLYGAGSDTDSLTAALVLPTVSAAVITGSLAYVLVPDLVSRFENPEEEKSAWQMASYVGLITLVVTGAVSLLLFAAAGPICDLLYSDMKSEQRTTTVLCLKILSLQVILSGAISWAQAILHSSHKFLSAALGGVIGIFVSVLFASQLGNQNIYMIAWAINVGSAVSLAIHGLPLLGKLSRPRVEHQTLVTLMKALWPLLLGAAFVRLDPLIDRVLASELDTGSITHVHFAQRIMMALLALGTSSLALIAFPQLAERLSKEGEAGFSQHLSLALSRMSLLVIPITIGVSLFAVEIVADLLQRGKFTAEDSLVVGWLVITMMGMFVGASAGELLARAFYVLGDTRTPTFIGVVSLACALALKFVLFKYFVGIWGIAIGVSVYFLSSAAIMTTVLSRKLGSNMFEGLGKNCLQALLATGVACACCYLIYSGRVLPQILSSTWVAGPVGGGVYCCALLATGNSDARRFLRAMRERCSQFATTG